MSQVIVIHAEMSSTNLNGYAWRSQDGQHADTCGAAGADPHERYMCHTRLDAPAWMRLEPSTSECPRVWAR